VQDPRRLAAERVPRLDGAEVLHPAVGSEADRRARSAVCDDRPGQSTLAHRGCLLILVVVVSGVFIVVSERYESSCDSDAHIDAPVAGSLVLLVSFISYSPLACVLFHTFNHVCDFPHQHQ
jgi:hypothetical protein